MDEILHLKIADAILDYDPPQTLVIASGDGNVSEFNTSFITQIQRALKHGWEAEVWAWGQTLAEKKYEKLQEESDGKLSIHYLDRYYRSLTFVKEGEYHERKPDGTKEYFTVEERIVQPL